MYIWLLLLGQPLWFLGGSIPILYKHSRSPGGEAYWFWWPHFSTITMRSNFVGVFSHLWLLEVQRKTRTELWMLWSSQMHQNQWEAHSQNFWQFKNSSSVLSCLGVFASFLFAGSYGTLFITLSQGDYVADWQGPTSFHPWGFYKIYALRNCLFIVCFVDFWSVEK